MNVVKKHCDAGRERLSCSPDSATFSTASEISLPFSAQCAALSERRAMIEPPVTATLLIFVLTPAKRVAEGRAEAWRRATRAMTRFTEKGKRGSTFILLIKKVNLSLGLE